MAQSSPVEPPQLCPPTKTFEPSGLTTISPWLLSSPFAGPLYRAVHRRAPVAASYAIVAESKSVDPPQLSPVTKTFDPSGLAAIPSAASSPFAGPS